MSSLHSWPEAILHCDADAFYVEDQSVSVQDFNATIAKAIDLPFEEEIFSPTGRPFNISNGGTPIKEIVG